METLDDRMLESLRQQNLALLGELRVRQAQVRDNLGVSLQGPMSQSMITSTYFNRPANGMDKYEKYEPASSLVARQNLGKHVMSQGTESFGEQTFKETARNTFQCEIPDKPDRMTLHDHHDHMDLESTKCSTPKAGEVHSMSATPRSILKHRKIIDDNIKVESKYDHTPTVKLTPNSKRDLNYSYSEHLAQSQKKISVGDENTSPTPSHMRETGLDGSYLEDCSRSPSPVTKAHKNEHNADIAGAKNLDDADMKKIEQQKKERLHALWQEKLLRDSGNDKKNAHIVTQLANRSQSVVLGDEKQDTGNSTASQLWQSKDSDMSHSRSTISQRGQRGQMLPTSGRPLLGYDWIAGALDNNTSLFDASENFFEEIRDFRRKNKGDCESSGPLEKVLDLTRPISPEVQDPAHTCIHGFTINKRLYPVPLNQMESGRSVCPVCLAERREPTPQSPSFVRVSIPRSTLEAPYHVKPHRRRSFDPTDSYALSSHCLAGWECSRPATIPTAKNVDIHGSINGLSSKLSSTWSEVEDMAKSFSRSSRLMAAPMRSKTTEDLLNTSCALRCDLQQLERDRGLTKEVPAFSTAYPML